MKIPRHQTLELFVLLISLMVSPAVLTFPASYVDPGHRPYAPVMALSHNQLHIQTISVSKLFASDRTRCPYETGRYFPHMSDVS